MKNIKLFIKLFLLFIFLSSNFAFAANVDWKQDTSLNLEEINVNLIKKFVKGKDIKSLYPQGMTFTDKYIILAQIKSNTDETYLTIIDKDNYKVLNIINPLCFGHANSLAYNEQDGRCYMSYTDGNDGKNYVSRFIINDEYQIEELEIREVEDYFGGFAFDLLDDCYIARKGKSICALNKDYGLMYSFKMNTELTKQDIAYYKNKVYCACYEAGVPSQYQGDYNSKEKHSNLIYIYNMQGDFLRRPF